MEQCTPSPRRTRVTNATKHPGLPDAPPRWRSHAEKVADDAHQSELLALQNAKAIHTYLGQYHIHRGSDASFTTGEACDNSKWCLPSKARTMTAKDGVVPAVILKGKHDP